MTFTRRALLWIGLIGLSVAVHLLLSWRAGHGLRQPVAVNDTPPPVAELSLAPVEEQEPEPLFFEEPLEFEPPEILVAGVSDVPPPPAVDLALRAAGPDAIFDVIDVFDDEALARLAAYASGTADARAGFWYPDDLDG